VLKNQKVNVACSGTPTDFYKQIISEYHGHHAKPVKQIEILHDFILSIVDQVDLVFHVK